MDGLSLDAIMMAVNGRKERCQDGVRMDEDHDRANGGG